MGRSLRRGSTKSFGWASGAPGLARPSAASWCTATPQALDELFEEGVGGRRGLRSRAVNHLEEKVVLDPAEEGTRERLDVARRDAANLDLRGQVRLDAPQEAQRRRAVELDLGEVLVRVRPAHHHHREREPKHCEELAPERAQVRADGPSTHAPLHRLDELDGRVHVDAQRRAKQVLLRGEALEDAPLGHARVQRDLHARRADPSLKEDLSRGAEDVFVADGDRARHWRRVAHTINE